MTGMGKTSVAIVSNDCRTSFPNVKLALFVGICGVVPFGPTNDDIILGDVVVSDGVIHYDLGRRLPDCFIRKTRREAFRHAKKYGKIGFNVFKARQVKENRVT